MLADSPPVRGRQNEDRQFAPGKLLLVAKVLIGRDDKIEVFSLSRREQCAVLKRLPSPLVSGADVMANRKARSGAGVP